ncbi:hypothetical protein ACOME3_007051 [Neoechinorhynchus agilis]
MRGSVYVGDDSHVRGNVFNSAIADRCILSDSVSLIECVLWSGVILEPEKGSGLKLEKCVIGNDVVIRSSMIADHLFICPRVQKTGIVVYDTRIGSQQVRISIDNTVLFNRDGFSMWGKALEESDYGVDTDQEDTTDSVDETEPELGQSLQAFEIHQTIYRAFLEELPDDQLVLEINGIKLAFNLVIQEIIEQSVDSCLGIIQATLEKQHDFVNAVARKFPFVFMKAYVNDCQTMIEFIEAFEISSLRNELVLQRAPELMMLFYENDLVDENAIVDYYAQPRLSEQKCIERKYRKDRLHLLRTAIKPFLEWLQNADIED